MVEVAATGKVSPVVGGPSPVEPVELCWRGPALSDVDSQLQLHPAAVAAGQAAIGRARAVAGLRRRLADELGLGPGEELPAAHRARIAHAHLAPGVRLGH